MAIGLGGPLSGGKSVTMRALALTTPILKDRRKLANYHFQGAEFLPNADLVNFLKDNVENEEEMRKKFSDSVFLVDEIMNLLNARRSGSALNELVIQFLTMVGKLDCQVLYTFQVWESQADKVLREFTDLIFFCERLKAETMSPIGYPDKFLRVLPYPVRISLELWEKNNLGVYVRRGKTHYDPAEFYGGYNTREMNLLDRSRFSAKELRK